MSIILPDELLQNQICTLCKLYLSCGPVKSYRNGVIYEVKCGRCSREEDEGGFSQYNAMAENVLFPCVNRFDGCDQLLRYRETSKHELTCPASKIRCPLCPEDDSSYVPLALANHFRSNHWKNVLDEPRIRLSSNTNQFYVHCNVIGNIFVLIHVVINDTHVNFKVMSSRTNRVEYKIRIFKKDFRQENSEVFSSRLMKCYDFDDDLGGFLLSISLIGNVQELECVLELSSVNQHMLQLPSQKANTMNDKCESEIQYEEESSSLLPERKVPDLHMDDIFKTKFGKTHLSSFDFSEDKNSIIDGATQLCVIIICNFCENYLAVSGRYNKLFFCASCSYSVCGQCHAYGITKFCPKCSLPELKRSGEMSRFYSFNFFCQFQCGQYCKAWDLLDHEDRCILNDRRGLTDKDNIWRYFKEKKRENDTFQRSNSIFFDLSRFSKDGRIFVVTRDGIRFVVEHQYLELNSAYKCFINHKYDNVDVSAKICHNEKYRQSGCTLFIPFNCDYVFFAVIFKRRFSD